MTEEQFWQIIHQSRADATDCVAQTTQLQQILSMFSPKEIVEFQQRFGDKIVAAYRWDLWGVAWLIKGGCSDDSFEYFCRWLIGQGRAAYESALSDPESILDLLNSTASETACEELFYVSSDLYEQITGEKMPAIEMSYPREPLGKPWTERTVVDRFPKVALRYSRH